MKDPIDRVSALQEDLDNAESLTRSLGVGTESMKAFDNAKSMQNMFGFGFDLNVGIGNFIIARTV